MGIINDTSSKNSENTHKKILDNKCDRYMFKLFPQKILLVEDNIINQKIIVLMLKNFGHTCDIASNGIEALEILDQNIGDDYSLIFMDLRMPRMNGIETTQKIIERFGASRPRIIAMTANTFDEDKEKCFNAGMDDFISKPIIVDDLRNILQNKSI